MGALDELMPMPTVVTPDDGLLPLAGFALSGMTPRLAAAFVRLGATLERRFGQQFPVILDVTDPNISIEIAHPGSGVPMPDMDESYRLHVTSAGIRLVAKEEVGALRALQTLAQLMRPAGEGDGTWTLPLVTIKDRPRFVWRGMLLDVSRHFMQVDDVMRLLDGMELAKLNVLHFHLANDQGFRVECETFPNLHLLGSEGEYYTKDEMRGLIGAAADRGIRIVPEFCLPGHSVAWQVAYPELSAITPPPQKVGEMRGSFSSPIDPTEEATYAFIDGFLAEMAELFPDPYFHTGGDEVNPTAWTENTKIASFMKEKGFAQARDLQAYFTGRYAELVASHGKTAVGWEEILHARVDENVILHLWKDGVYPPDLARHPILVSWNYYLDLQQPAHWLYARDPHDFRITDDAEAADLNVLGAEMANWAESLNGDNLDVRTWPRAAAVAERFWSVRAYCDGAGAVSLYRRLAVMSGLLSAAGLTHISHVEEAMTALYGEADADVLAEFAAVIEPAAYPFLRRRRLILERLLPRLFSTPDVERYSDVRRFVDQLAAESDAGRQFVEDVSVVIATNGGRGAAALAQQLDDWQGLSNRVRRIAERNVELRKENIGQVAAGLGVVARIGSIALETLQRGKTLSPLRGWWLKRRLRAYAYEIFYLDVDVVLRVIRSLRKPDALNRHNVAIVPGVAHLLKRACGEEA